MHTTKHTGFVQEEAGLSGAEKALVLCVALALMAGVGTLVSRGSGSAAGDAGRTLATGAGGSGPLGEVVRPLGGTGEIAAPDGVQEPGESTLLVSFSSDYAPRPPESRPPPAPAAERRVIVEREGRNVVWVAIERTGILPAHDPALEVLRDALGNPEIDPATVRGTVTVWRREQGGRATVDLRGTVHLVRGDHRVVLFSDGAFQVATSGANLHFDAQGRLRSLGVLGRQGTTIFLAGSYDFTYGPDGQPGRVVVRGGPHEGTWTRGPDGRWVSDGGRRWSGADDPGTWARTLAGHGRLIGISAAALRAIDDEMTRLRDIWKQYLPDIDGLGLRTFRHIVGSGFSGNIGRMQRLAREIQHIRAEIDGLRTLQLRLADSQDPVEIARLAREFSQRALALRDRIDRFRDDSARVVGQSMRAGRAWAIAQDVYGLGTANGVVSGLWNLNKLIQDVVGR